VRSHREASEEKGTEPDDEGKPDSHANPKTNLIAVLYVLEIGIVLDILCDRDDLTPRCLPDLSLRLARRLARPY